MAQWIGRPSEGPGLPAAILERHKQGQISILIPRQVRDELVVAIARKRPALPTLRDAFIVEGKPEVAADPTVDELRAVGRCISPTDAPILAAITSGADCWVSGNTRHTTQEAAAHLATLVL